MLKGKNLLNSLVLVLIGIIVGGVVGYGISNPNILKETLPKGTASISQTTCDLSGQTLSTEAINSDSANAATAYLKFKEIKESHIPTGVPAVYGEELSISFDQVQDAINKVRVYGPTYGREGKKITLTGQDLERYINITSQTSCQYCCGVKALIREDGSAACGCAHSIMMRGLAAYLIKNHPELSDGQILDELNTWKITYFPKQTLTEKLSEMEKTGEPGIKEILEEFPEFMPQMVGGC